MKKVLILLIFITIGCNKTLNTGLDNNPYYFYLGIPLQNNKVLEFALILPEYFSRDQSYPVLLALPPGYQTRAGMEWAVEKYWIRQSIQRNWIVVSPVAPGGQYFHKGSELYISTLMDTIQHRYNVEGEKFHVAGISNGGISSFRIAIQYTNRIQSLTVFPGFPPTEADYALLNRLINIPVTMYVGALDSPDWIDEMDSTATILQNIGVQVTFKIFPGEGHVINSLTSEMLFDLLEDLRP